jgi:hypothetical protein
VKWRAGTVAINFHLQGKPLITMQHKEAVSGDVRAAGIIKNNNQIDQSQFAAEPALLSSEKSTFSRFSIEGDGDSWITKSAAITTIL